MYKVKYGDNLNKIAAYYSVENIMRDNHISKLMCYEGDILFIRNPDPAVIDKPYENDLSSSDLAKLTEMEGRLGYEAAQCAFYGEPINMSTGDFYLEHTDFDLPELDKEFKFSRSYNSMGGVIRSDFGYGFNSIVNDRLMVNSDGTVMHFREDGGGETYRTNGDGTYSADNKLEAVYSGSILLAAYTYDGDGTITSTLDRDLDLNQNLNINDRSYLNRLTNNQRQLINKVPVNDSFLYELTEYVTDKNRPYSETLMERDGTGQLFLVYTYGNQRLNAENYNNLTGIYTYDGRGSVSAVIGGYGDFRASYWYDGLGNVKSQVHGYGVFGSGKKYYGYNAEQYNPVTGNQNLRARQVNIRRQRFLSEDTYLGNKTDILSLNRYIYGNDNPLKYKDPSGFISNVIMSSASKVSPGLGCFGGGSNLVQGFTGTEMDFEAIMQLALQTNAMQIHQMIYSAILQSLDTNFFEVPGDNNNVVYNNWYYGNTTSHYAWCSVFVIFNSVNAGLANGFTMPTLDVARSRGMESVNNLRQWYVEQGRYHKFSDDYTPKIGDVVFMQFYDSSTGKYQNHTGFVVSYENGVVNTIEGNTNDGGSRDGDGVYLKQRSKDIIGYGDNLYIY